MTWKTAVIWLVIDIRARYWPWHGENIPGNCHCDGVIPQIYWLYVQLTGLYLHYQTKKPPSIIVNITRTKTIWHLSLSLVYDKKQKSIDNSPMIKTHYLPFAWLIWPWQRQNGRQYWGKTQPSHYHPTPNPTWPTLS